MSNYPKENVVPALLLVLGAGLSTGIGAAVVFVPSLVKLASRRVLAASLGFSAGVMTYISFVEIFGKSHSGFLDAGHAPERAYTYATLCFFGGIFTMLVRINMNETNRKTRRMQFK
jgi:ZIP family zinc transporter